MVESTKRHKTKHCHLVSKGESGSCSHSCLPLLGDARSSAKALQKGRERKFRTSKAIAKGSGGRKRVVNSRNGSTQIYHKLYTLVQRPPPCSRPTPTRPWATGESSSTCVHHRIRTEGATASKKKKRKKQRGVKPATPLIEGEKQQQQHRQQQHRAQFRRVQG